MSAKVFRCDRCWKRCRNAEGWNAVFIAGLIVGNICPNCQTPQEDLEAELDLMLCQTPAREVRTTDPGGLETVIGALVRCYPTPEIMRDKATQLEAARRDQMASGMARLMRRIADDMESGELWEDS
jgi:hypothetical protein